MFATLVVATNPPAVAAILRGVQLRRELALAAGVAVLVAALAALVSDPVLDALDVTPATFQIATSVVLGVAGARWLVVGPWRLPDDIAIRGWRRAVVPLLVPVLVTPQLVAVSTSLGADHGVGVVGVGAATAMALAWAASLIKVHPLFWAVASRFVGLGAVVLALALASDGIRTV